MSLSKWKIENYLCRCCNSEGSYVNLAEPRIVDGENEIYSEMLQECFNITLTPVQGELHDLTYSICESCINKVREALYFKQQVLECEKTFQNMYSKNCLVGSSLLQNVKIEIDVSDDEITGRKKETAAQRKRRLEKEKEKQQEQLNKEIERWQLNAQEESITDSTKLFEKEIKAIQLKELTAEEEQSNQLLNEQQDAPTQCELQTLKAKNKYKKKISRETPEDRERRLAMQRQYNADRRRKESPKSREFRLAQVRENSFNRRREESPNSRKYRLVQQRLYNHERRRNESPNSRKLRLAGQSQSSKKRRSAESPASRELRLSQQRQYNGSRRSNESPTTSELRHAQMREVMAKRRREESPNTRESRLEKQRLYSERRRRTESPKSREIRLAKQKKFNEKRGRKRPSQTSSEFRLTPMFDNDEGRCEESSFSESSQAMTDSAYDLCKKGTEESSISSYTPSAVYRTKHETKGTIEPPKPPFDPDKAIRSYSTPLPPSLNAIETVSVEWNND